MQHKQSISYFKEQSVRKVQDNKELYFVLKDILPMVSDNIDTKDCIKDLKRRNPELITQRDDLIKILPVATTKGIQKLKCANLESIIKILNFMRSSKIQQKTKILEARLQQTSNNYKTQEANNQENN
jgi:prophage antirepressor-like protein